MTFLQYALFISWPIQSACNFNVPVSSCVVTYLHIPPHFSLQL